VSLSKDDDRAVGEPARNFQLEAESGEFVGRPPAGVRLGRFADHEPPALTQQRCPAFGDDGRRSERASDDEVELRPVPRIMRCVLRRGADHSDAIAETQFLDRIRQEHGSALACVQQDPPRLRPPRCEGQTRYAAA
jgi:hypothetical protein